MFDRTFGASMRARRLMLDAALVLAIYGALVGVAAAKPLSMRGALVRALASDFGASATVARIQGAEAGIRQAGRGPNPTVGADIENFAGTGAYRGLRAPQTTLYVQQPIEWGGKREARTAVAQSELEGTRMRGALRTLDLFREVEVAWIDVVSATAQIKVAEDRLSIARQLQVEIARRAESGRDPAYLQSRAEAQVALEQIAVDQGKAAARIARANLAGYWKGGANYEADNVAFENVAPPAEGKVVFNVDTAVLETERELAAARVTLERARGIPDPAIRIGIRHIGDTRDTALVAGISIPLPLFDNNQGNIDRASANQRAADFDIAAAKVVLRRELTRLQARMVANATEARRINAEVVPAAERAVHLIRDGMERGGFSYVEFSDAQRTLSDARLRRIEAIKAYHLDMAALNRLTGRHMNLLSRIGSR
jgi:cobalt-zinc-cadmium efflux system outer membrane protein